MRQQEDALRMAMSKHQDTVQQWVTMKNKNKSLEDMTAEDLLNRLNVEVSEMKAQVKSQIPQQFKKRKDRLNRLQVLCCCSLFVCWLVGCYCFCFC